MRRLRWKKQWESGHTGLDEGNKRLAEILNGYAGLLGQEEHCQDMDDFGEALVGALEAKIASDGERAADPGSDRDPDGHVMNLLGDRLPLPTRQTPQCKDCGLCDSLQVTLEAWYRHET
mgnify:CR=1 FL=1